MKTRIKFIAYFADGNIFTGMQFFPGAEVVVDEVTLAQITASGGEFEVLGKIVPKSSVKKEKPQPKEQVADD